MNRMSQKRSEIFRRRLLRAFPYPKCPRHPLVPASIASDKMLRLVMGMLVGIFFVLGENRSTLGSESVVSPSSESAGFPKQLRSDVKVRSSSAEGSLKVSEGPVNTSSPAEQAWMTRMLREEFSRWLTSRSESLFSQLQAEFERWWSLRGSGQSENATGSGRPPWVDSLPEVIDGEYWQTVKAGPYATSEDCQAELRTEILKTVVSYAQKRFDAPFAQKIPWDIESLLPHMVTDQWEETRLIDFGPNIGRRPMSWLYGRLRFNRQVQEEILRQYRRAVIHSRLWKLAGGMTGLLGLVGLSYGVLRLRCKRLYPPRVY